MDEPATSRILRLGMPTSLMARRHGAVVAAALTARHAGLRVEVVEIGTNGDEERFEQELDLALLEGRIDFTVNSLKDIPMAMPAADASPLVVAAVLEREDPCDVLVCASASMLMDLPRSAKVGTCSLRRRCQLLALRPDLRVSPLSGNIEARLRRARSGEFDAIIVARAGLKRSGLDEGRDLWAIPVDELLPAPGQAALALRCRRDDQTTIKRLTPLDDAMTHRCVDLERQVVAGLQGDCQSPIAALASVEHGMIRLRVAVGAGGGEPPVIHASALAGPDEPQRALEAVLSVLTFEGAADQLRRRRGDAPPARES